MRKTLKTIQARHLRKNMTDAEQALWQQLRFRQVLGYKFRRQHPIGPYICDFVCLEKMLVIEVDGGQHLERKQYDNQRDNFLELYGFIVLRFWNHEVLLQRDSVLEAIYRYLASGEIPYPP
jgi:very-short-patch-repair endonuclease